MFNFSPGFGFTTNSLGQQPTSIFGQSQPQTPNPFAVPTQQWNQPVNPQQTLQQPIFGQPNLNLFGQAQAPLVTPFSLQPEPQQQQQGFPLWTSQPFVQSQNSNFPSQSPYILQPIYQPIILLPEQQYPFGDSSGFDSRVPTFASSASSLPAKYLRTSLLTGRGPSILTPDPKFQSPFFEWSRNPQTGEICAIGFNKDLVSTVMKSPGEEVIDRARRARSDDRVQLETLKAQVKLLQGNSSYNDNHTTMPMSDKYDRFPPPIGLFDQQYSTREHLHDSWEDLKRKDEFAGPPKYNDGIDPITGRTLLEKFANPFDRKWKMRPLIGSRPHGSSATIDTVFDLPPSYQNRDQSFPSPDAVHILHHKKPFHTLIPNITDVSTPPERRSVPRIGQIRLGPRITEDLAPRFRPPTRIGGGDNALFRPPGSVCGVKLTKSKYYCVPNLETLDFMHCSFTGQTLVDDFTIGHADHGQIVFPGKINVSGVNLDSIVDFSHKQVEVYQEGSNKPAYGQELNRRAIVTLQNVFPKCKVSGESIRDLEKIKACNYAGALKGSCERFNGRFMNYNPITGSWVFEIQREPTH